MPVANVVPLEQPEPPSDVALKIEMAQDIGGGQKVHFSTYTERDCATGVLRGVLEKMSSAADWLGAKYALRNLELQLEQEEKQLLDFQEQRDLFLLRCKTEWEIGNRRGPAKLYGAQQNTDQQFQNSINSRKQVLEKLRKDIAITKKILESSG